MTCGLTPRLPMSVHKKISPFGPAVWPARGNIYMNVLFYYIDKFTLNWRYKKLLVLGFPKCGLWLKLWYITENLWIHHKMTLCNKKITKDIINPANSLKLNLFCFSKLNRSLSQNWTLFTILISLKSVVYRSNSQSFKSWPIRPQR